MAASKRGSGKVTFSSPQFRLQRVKAKATTTPVASPGQLRGIWAREFGTYRVRIVRVLKRRGSVLTFSLSGNPPGSDAEGPFSVDLDDGLTVWGDLPSTAQLVNPASNRRFGYLLLNENWLRENVPSQHGEPVVAAKAMTLVSSASGGDAASSSMGPKIPEGVSL